MRGIVGVALALALSQPAHALEILRADVTHDDGRYYIDFDVLIEAPATTVRALMTDYPRLAQLSDLVMESIVTEPPAPAPRRLSLRLRACVWVYCRIVRKVEDIHTDVNGDILTRAVPGGGDFSFSEERWRIMSTDSRTRLHYTGAMAPSFSVPPLIGPLLLKYTMRRELTNTVHKIEQLAATP